MVFRMFDVIMLILRVEMAFPALINSRRDWSLPV